MVNLEIDDRRCSSADCAEGDFDSERAAWPLKEDRRGCIGEDGELCVRHCTNECKIS